VGVPIRKASATPAERSREAAQTTNGSIVGIRVEPVAHLVRRGWSGDRRGRQARPPMRSIALQSYTRRNTYGRRVANARDVRSALQQMLAAHGLSLEM
jgi:hypothetical protein